MKIKTDVFQKIIKIINKFKNISFNNMGINKLKNKSDEYKKGYFQAYDDMYFQFDVLSHIDEINKKPDETA